MKKVNQFLFFIAFLFPTVLFADMDIQQCEKLIHNSNGKTTTYKEMDAYYKCSDELALKNVLTKYFHFNNEKTNDMQDYYTKMLTSFFKGLRECKPGNYEFIMNMNSAVKANIHGIQNNACVVDMNYQYATSDSLGPTKQHCEFEQVNLPIFTDNAALIMTAFTDKQINQTRGNAELAQTAKQTQDGVTGNFDKYCKS